MTTSPRSDLPEPRQVLLEIADAIDALTFTRTFAGMESGHGILKLLRDLARETGHDNPDRPLWNRAAMRERVRQLSGEIRSGYWTQEARDARRRGTNAADAV